MLGLIHVMFVQNMEHLINAESVRNLCVLDAIHIVTIVRLLFVQNVLFRRLHGVAEELDMRNATNVMNVCY